MNACNLVAQKLSSSPEFWGAFSEALSDAIVDSVAVVAVLSLVAVLIFRLARGDHKSKIVG